MKLWIDDARPAPKGYVWCLSVNQTKAVITTAMKCNDKIDLVDLDHDAGIYACDGGDYIRILDWLEEYDVCYFPIHIHSQNPVGIANMRAIIQKNGWREIR